MPAQPVANGSQSKSGAAPIVVLGMNVMAGRPQQIEAHAILSPVRRALESGHEKAVECDRAFNMILHEEAIGCPSSGACCISAGTGRLLSQSAGNPEFCVC
ncbi:hypothetical protein [Mesorhizobium sp. WSM3876]|uniref:hypothetical protein n=1 Tax=Mesorhizobium sp. WSM3876 TaxID=422277 RepID=UPI001FE0567A|nr:hypothetical protein [Mesorhizobium sp. WSM3876]